MCVGPAASARMGRRQVGAADGQAWGRAARFADPRTGRSVVAGPVSGVQGWPAGTARAPHRSRVVGAAAAVSGNPNAVGDGLVRVPKVAGNITAAPDCEHRAQ